MVGTFTGTLRGQASRFALARSGNVAMIYALALLPTIAVVGSAIDLSRAMVVKMRLGEALDAAGLSVAGTIGMTQAQMTAKAQAFFYANYPPDELGTVTSLSVAPDPNNSQLVKISGSAKVDTAFMKLFGYNSINIAVNAEVTRESKGLEIALVLDNTGSMAQNGKLPALKSATTMLINTLFGNQSSPTTLKMSLVPFSQTVKVSTTVFNNSGWMDSTGASSTARLNFDNNKYAFAAWSAMNNKSWGGCLEARPGGLEETDDTPVAAVPNSRWVPYFEPDGPDSNAYSGYTTYVADGVANGSNQETRLKNSAKYTNLNSNSPNNDCDIQQILPLTSSKSTLLSYVSGMIANGYTHIAIGAGWGWRTLSPTAPYTEGASYSDPDWRKAVVLLTDGLNTIPSNNTYHKSTYTAYNFLVRNQLGTTNASAAETEQDTRTNLVCTRMKAAGIRIYTVLLEENAQRAKDLMEDCASVDDNDAGGNKCNGNNGKLCYESPSASQLQSVFSAIANDISNLRLSK